MSAGIKTLVERVGESRVYTFDFTNFPEVVGGETLSSITSLVSAPAGLTISGQALSGTKKVTCRITGGVLGVTYFLACKVLTSGGNTLVCVGNLYLDRAT